MQMVMKTDNAVIKVE